MATTTEAAPAILADAEFLQLMGGMQARYTAAPPAGAAPPAFILPPHVAALALRRPLATLPAVDEPDSITRVLAQPTVAHLARPVMAATQRTTLDFIDFHRRTVTAALNQVHGAGDTAAFVAAMEALERREQAEQAIRIETMYSGLIAAGRAHPAARPAILVASNSTGGFLHGLLGDCHAALHGVVAEVQHAGGAAAHAAGTVAQWAGHAAQSVGRFFGSLF